MLCFQSLTEIFYSFSKFSLLGLQFLFPFFSLVNFLRKLSLCLSRHFFWSKKYKLYFSCVLAKRGSWSQVFLGETVETGVENRGVTDNIFRAPCMFCEEGLGKINAKDVQLFQNGSVHEFYRLKALITSKQVNTSVVGKKKNISEKTSMGKLTGRVLFQAFSVCK